MPHNIEKVNDLQQSILFDPNTPKSGEIWIHSATRNRYIVEGLAMAENNEDTLVLYTEATNNNSRLPYPWARPLIQWNEMVEVDGQTVARFQKAGNSELAYNKEPNTLLDAVSQVFEDHVDQLRRRDIL